VLLFSRGLYALVLSLFITQSLQAEFLYKDEIIDNSAFEREIDVVGKELRDKTGISIYIVALRDLENNTTLEATQARYLNELPDKTILITFVEMTKSVDIVCRPTSLYKDFNKDQVLSPFPTFLSALYMATFYGNWEEKKFIINNCGGSIIPILAQRTKGSDTVKKYSVALFNGYADISEQIATSQDVILESAVGNSNKITRNVLRTIFYGTILIALSYYIYSRFLKKRREDDE